jgi:hypothetical protein
MKQEHHPKGVRLNNLGANTSDEKINTGAGDKGFYVDSNNGRLKSFDGNNGDWEKIKGEVILYDDGGEPGDWLCIGSHEVKGRIFSVWVEENGLDDPIIRINGTKVAQSPDLPFDKLHPLQMDANNGCGEAGEIFLTDDFTTPLYFDLQDMLDNSSGDKYFAGFNYESYTINLNKPLDIPVFVDLENVGGSGGLPVGVYQYAIAYVTKSGDRTTISEKTPTIPVVRSLSEGTRSYPGVRTYGDSPDENSKTSYGPRIRFRVTNKLNYDSIEIIRYDYNIGAGINFTPSARVVGRIDISDGQIDVVDFVDPVDSDRNILLSVEEETQQTYLIDTAKGIRYYGQRVVLGNVKLVEKEDTSTLKTTYGETVLPIVDNLGPLGHNVPYSHSYRPSEMGGEKATYGIHFWDAVGGRTFVKEDPSLTNLQYPNRRDPMSTGSSAYSLGDKPVAADIDGNVSFVHESFDHKNAISRGDKDNFKNIVKKGTRLEATVDENTSTDHEDYRAASAPGGVRPQYLVWEPTDQNDQGDSHDMLANVEVDTDGFFGLGDKHDYDPQCFASDFYAKGHVLSGIDNIPDWVKSFSIVRTESAGRVVCQGLGAYKILPGSYDGASSDKITKKHKSQMWFFSPDVDSGLVSQAEIDNIKNNPQDYKVQFVSPLGFFSDVYSFESNAFKDHLCDMITHVKVMRDQGQINPGTDPTTGPNGYVYYNKYRGVDSPLFDVNEGWFSGSDGNKEMGLDLFEEIREGRGTYFTIGFDEDIYGVRNVGGTGKRDFDDDGLKNWTEPMYMINIIKTGAEAPNGDIQGYRSTGTHVKLDSIIGLGTGVDLTQEFPLVDERWEDCCYTTEFNPDDRYVYLKNVNDNTERVFYDATNASPALIAIIQADILTNGFWISPSGKNVVGLYTHENTGSNPGIFKNHEFVIKFTFTGDHPTDEEYVVVRYDNRIPVRFFGGDMTTADAVFAPVDRQLKLESVTDTPEDTEQFVLNVAFPYGRYKMNPRYYRVRDLTSVDKVQNSDWFSFSHMRQMIMMFYCDNRIAGHFAFNEDYPLEYFPLTHYVMRANVWNEQETLKEQSVFDEYAEDYPGEYPDRWEYGGFRFLQNFNVDYSSRGITEFFSKPEVGFEEKFEFCNRVIWSLPRATNQQDSPSLKTFLVGNTFDIEDAQGEIKFLYGATWSDKGSNLYAIAERGVCLLLTQKSILSNIDSNFLTSVSSDQFIAQEFWIEREMGCDDEFWRGRAEGTIPVPSEVGEMKLETCFWPSRDTVYMLFQNIVRDIGDKEYLNTLKPYLDDHSSDASLLMNAVYDDKHHEYWLTIASRSDIQCFKFYAGTMQWVGRQDYRFDQLVFADEKVFGLRDYEVYELNQGFIINGDVIEAWITQVFSKEPFMDKEFIEIGVETGGRSGEKPTKIQFLDQNGVVIADMSQTINGPNWLLRYDNWRQFIPRRSDNDNRLQDQLLIYKIFHNLAVDFKVVNTTVQYKVLK